MSQPDVYATIDPTIDATLATSNVMENREMAPKGANYRPNSELITYLFRLAGYTNVETAAKELRVLDCPSKRPLNKIRNGLNVSRGVLKRLAVMFNGIEEIQERLLRPLELKDLGVPADHTEHDDWAPLESIVKPMPTPVRKHRQTADARHRVPSPELPTFDDIPKLPEPFSRRDNELRPLLDVWHNRSRSGPLPVVQVTGLPGVGKTVLASAFVREVSKTNSLAPARIIWCDVSDPNRIDAILDGIIARFTLQPSQRDSIPESKRAQDIATLLESGYHQRPVILVLDGLDSCQEKHGDHIGRIQDNGLRSVLDQISDVQTDCLPGMLLITTCLPISSTQAVLVDHHVSPLSCEDGNDENSELKNAFGLCASYDDAYKFCKEIGGHIGIIAEVYDRLKQSQDVNYDDLMGYLADDSHSMLKRVLWHCDSLTKTESRLILLLSHCVRFADERDIREVFLASNAKTGTGKAKAVDNHNQGFGDGLPSFGRVHAALERLVRLGIVAGTLKSGYRLPSIVKVLAAMSTAQELSLSEAQARELHGRFFERLQTQISDKPFYSPEESEIWCDVIEHGCRAGRQRDAWHLYRDKFRRHNHKTCIFPHANRGTVLRFERFLRLFFPNEDFHRDPIACGIEDPACRAKLKSDAATVLFTQGRIRKSLAPLLQGLFLYLQANGQRRASRLWLNLARCYFCLGRLRAAQDAIGQALECYNRCEWSDPRKRRQHMVVIQSFFVRVLTLLGDTRWREYYNNKKYISGKAGRLHVVHGFWHSIYEARNGDFRGARRTWQTHWNHLEVERSKRRTWQFSVHEETFALAAKACITRLAWQKGDQRRQDESPIDLIKEAISRGEQLDGHYFRTYAYLEAGRCYRFWAEYCRAESTTGRNLQWKEHLSSARAQLEMAERRANESGYRMIQASAMVTRAELLRLEGKVAAAKRSCVEAIAICSDPDCDYAWASEDAKTLLRELDGKPGRERKSRSRRK